MAVKRDKIIITVKDLSYSYDGVKALDKVSFEAGEGEILTILGPNGAGKTTLLKCILKILKPHGAIYIDGENINKMSNRELAKRVGYVPQTHSSIFAYRIIDYVIMGRAPYHSLFSMPSRKEYEKALHLLELLGIKDLTDRTIAEISGGQFQLVLIARALMQEAKILLLDEPIAHLDTSNKLRVLSIIKKLVKEGIIKTVIMSLHDPLLAALYSDKIILLKNGRLIAYGSPDEVLTQENLLSLYGIEFDRIYYNGRLLIIPRNI